MWSAWKLVMGKAKSDRPVEGKLSIRSGKLNAWVEQRFGDRRWCEPWGWEHHNFDIGPVPPGLSNIYTEKATRSNSSMFPTSTRFLLSAETRGYCCWDLHRERIDPRRRDSMFAITSRLRIFFEMMTLIQWPFKFQPVETMHQGRQEIHGSVSRRQEIHSSVVSQSNGFNHTKTQRVRIPTAQSTRMDVRGSTAQQLDKVELKKTSGRAQCAAHSSVKKRFGPSAYPGSRNATYVIRFKVAGMYPPNVPLVVWVAAHRVHACTPHHRNSVLPALGPFRATPDG
ncbi:hypothetical protein FB45DRAFT_874710 [Roridomyces roridus]|uniref:Uncharacterized protein n=1 Tax=Roridomyces roridus TaxID=1738132 RepID=A0AAD7B8R1_9AGAR|nr:hypothetical protein FB45DRAFT_874710 [Roridomyces roridus]